ncbi:S9 family peptidase [Parvularcula lutaonensis]|uniref:Alpha/beta fold hydrolase n=1 Tax=Parvularcula lutaonensis TaxID=491923 RepID=A0ABV7MBD0_9PROT|nr:S9 family peptidase [Parvularcula lutaonensis]GGY40302.1 peptidase S9 [Parvularcula lutaonensis]
MLITMLTASAAAIALQASQSEQDWEFPEDIPSPAPASVGLAGAEPPNVVRFFKVTGASGGTISPDGETVLFTSSITGEPQVFAVPDEGGQPKQLTFGTGVSGFGFAPDGRIRIAADTDGNERVGYTLLTVDGHHEERLLDASEAFNSFGDFDDDGDRFVFATTRRNGTDFDIYLSDDDGVREVYEGRFGFFPQAWRPGTDEVIVTETRGEDGNVLHLLDVSTGELTTLLNPEDISNYQSFVFKPDGSGFWMATNHGREFQALAFFDLEAFEETGDANAALSFLHEHDDRDIEDVELAGGRYLVWTENEDGYSGIGAFDVTRNNRRVFLPELPRGIYSLDGAKDAAKLAVTLRGPTTPGTVGLLDLTKRRPRFDILAEPQDGGLDLASFQAPKPVRFEARDGVELQGLLYRPDTEGNAPVVIMVHGGPTAQARPTFEPLAQYLTTRGIAVLDLNFRGSTGFGKSFARMDNGRNRTKAVDDVADAVAWLKQADGLDGERVAIMGGSYGGYLTNAAVGAYPDLFKAGVSLVGVSDWVRALEEASPYLKASDVIEYGDITDPEERAFFASISPINNVDRIKAAMLFSHGANDPRDPVSESDRMVKALRERGVEVKYLRWPDEGHSVRKLNNRVHLYQEITKFLEDHLGTD